MRLIQLLAGLPAVAAATGHYARDTKDTLLPPVPKKFIVEAHESVSLDELVSKIEAAGARVNKRYESSIFTGLSVETGHNNIDSLQEVQQVARAWPVNRYHLSPIEATTSEVGDISEEAGSANFSVHWATGVDVAHAAGIYGKGVKIAVIDSGIDYNHRALGGGIGAGFQIEGGYDLVGDTFTGENKNPDTDPMDELGHGTHVAGILFGKTESFVGVAPEASILAYKVFGAIDGTTDDILVQATLMAYEAGVDIITSSVGRTSGFANGVWAEVCSRIVDQGVVVTIAAGNDGESGPFYASSGSTGYNVLSVAAMDTGRQPSSPFRVTFQGNATGQTNTSTLAYIPSNNRPAWNITGLPLYPVHNITEGCSVLEKLANPAKAVIMVPRPEGYIYDLQDALTKCGARWILAANTGNRTGYDTVIMNPKSDMVLIDQKAGEALLAAAEEGDIKMTVDFSVSATDDSWQVDYRQYNGGIPSYYTSWGGSYELAVKPDVAAPGTDIWSTLPNNTWGVKSGTSMACPYVAGIAALYISVHGGRAQHGADFPKMLAERIISSGKELPWQVIGPVSTSPKDFGNYTAPVPQIGSGLINATKILNFTTSLRFPQRFALNDTNNFERYHKVQITNNGDKDVTYTFALEPAGGFNAQGRTPSILGDILDTSPQTLVPEVSFPSDGKIVVPAGATKEAQINFMYPQVEDPSQLPIYSGRVRIDGDNGESLVVPYFGAAFDLKKQLRGQLFPEGTPYGVIGPHHNETFEDHSVFAFDVSTAAQDYPRFLAEFMWGVDELRFDIYETTYRERDWKYPPVVGENGYVGSATYSPYADSYGTFDPSSMDRENVLPFPRKEVPRSESWDQVYTGIWWMGKLANGSYIAPGNYSLRFAARLPFSNPDHSDNWQIWKTPNIEVVPYKV